MWRYSSFSWWTPSKAVTHVPFCWYKLIVVLLLMQAFLTGCSAGGLATLIHCDDFRELLPKDATVKCLADAGFFLNEYVAVISHTFSTNNWTCIWCHAGYRASSMYPFDDLKSQEKAHKEKFFQERIFVRWRTRNFSKKEYFFQTYFFLLLIFLITQCVVIYCLCLYGLQWKSSFVVSGKISVGMTLWGLSITMLSNFRLCLNKCNPNLWKLVRVKQFRSLMVLAQFNTSHFTILP